MKVDLIQIGDYFAYPTQTVHDGKWKIGRVNLIRHDGIVQVDFLDTKAELLEPIELTPSILEKNHFKECLVVNGFGSIDEKLKPYHITKELYVYNGWCGTLVCYSNGEMAVNHFFECKFVHQFQHILKESGILNEIEL